MADHAQDGLFREIDEELRQEHYATLWKRYGKYIIALAVLLVVSVAGFQSWRYYDVQQRQGDSESFSYAQTLVRTQQFEEAAGAFAAVAAEAGPGYAMLARFQEAGAQVRQGNHAEAAEIYRSIAGNGDYDAVYRQLASLLQAIELLDTDNLNEAIDLVTPLDNEGNPWRHGAREVLAMAAMRSGDIEAAREGFTRLSEDPAVPAGIRGRASEMLSVLGS